MLRIAFKKKKVPKDLLDQAQEHSQLSSRRHGRTKRGLFSSSNMRHLIKVYLQSRPGLQTIEHRSLMRFICPYHNGNLDDDEKLRLRRHLITRLQLNMQANQYANFWGYTGLEILNSGRPVRRPGSMIPPPSNFFSKWYSSLACSMLIRTWTAGGDRIIASQVNIWRLRWPLRNMISGSSKLQSRDSRHIRAQSWLVQLR